MRAFLEQNAGCYSKADTRFYSKNALILFQQCPHFTHSYMRAFLEQGEDIFGIKSGVSLGIAAGILFQKYPQFVPKIPSIHSTYLRVFLE
jgi:hypothetical protein